MLLTIGLSGTPSLCILGSPCNLGGLELVVLSCRRVSSVNEDFFLSSSVVFCSVVVVGSLATLLYAESYRSADIFYLFRCYTAFYTHQGHADWYGKSSTIPA